MIQIQVINPNKTYILCYEPIFLYNELFSMTLIESYLQYIQSTGFTELIWTRIKSA